MASLVQLQLVIDETVCESNGATRVCVQLGTDTEREVTASVQTSDLSARSESCMPDGGFTRKCIESIYQLIVTSEVNLSIIIYNETFPSHSIQQL